MNDTSNHEEANGGPAFPTVARDGNWKPHHDGMTLRDYFAAKYLEGYVANPERRGFKPDEAAEYAYTMADFMLKTRKK